MPVKIDFNDPKLEGIKQFLRIVLIAILPVVIAQLQAGTFEPRSIFVALFTAVYSGIDKYDYLKKQDTVISPLTNVLKLEGMK
jgi:hypothetical protein